MKSFANRLTAGAIVAAVLLTGTAYAFLRIFTQWSASDDEGYVLQSIRSYLDGHALYDDVFSQYGPAFYLLQSLVHGVLRIPLTHDAARLTTVVLWVATTATTAAIVYRLTRSPVLSVLAFAQTLVHLAPLIAEPGHPQALLAFITALACFAVADAHGVSRGRAAACGALGAIAALTKVNVGVYLLLGIAIPLALATALRRFVAPLAIAAVAALPFVVTLRHAGDRAANLALVVALSATTAVLVCYRRNRSAVVSLSAVWVLAAAFLTVLLAIVLAVMVQGTSLGGLVQAILVQPSKFAGVFFVPLSVSSHAVYACTASLVLALVVTSRRAESSPYTLPVIVLAKALFAGLAFRAVAVGYVAQLEYLAPFLWLVIWDRTPDQPAGLTSSRSVLVLVAVLEILQSYPVAGTQVVVGTFLIVPAALVCLTDVRAFAADRLAQPSLAAVLIAAGAVAVAAPALLGALEWKMWRQLYLVYRTLPELRLPGSSLVKLPAPEVARLQLLAGTAAANCSTLLTFPGVYSLNAWSGVAPPTHKNATTWMTLMSDAQQSETWRAIDTAPAPCVIFNPTLAANWLDTRPLESLTAYRELTTRFEPVLAIDGNSLMMRNSRQPTGGRSRALPIHLTAGLQTFTNDRSPLPIASTVLRRHVPSTVRVWFRTRRRGVVIGCESDPAERGSHRWLPLIYVGRSGHVYGQYSTESDTVQASPAVITDGAWHQVVLVRAELGQTLYVDGVRAASTDHPVDAGTLGLCQVGAGASTGWPDAPDGVLRFVGDVSEVVLFPAAVTAEEVAADWAQRTRRRP